MLIIILIKTVIIPIVKNTRSVLIRFHSRKRATKRRDTVTLHPESWLRRKACMAESPLPPQTRACCHPRPLDLASPTEMLRTSSLQRNQTSRTISAAKLALRVSASTESRTGRGPWPTRRSFPFEYVPGNLQRRGPVANSELNSNCET